MGASDLPLAVRQRIESRWSQQIKRQQQQQHGMKAGTPSTPGEGSDDRKVIAIVEDAASG